MNTTPSHPLAALALLAASTLCATPAFAAPGLVPIHGVIADSEGVPLEGLQDVAFALYPGEFASDPVWSSERAVAVDAGRFVAYLGEATSLELDLFAEHSELWLGVAIGDDPELDRLQLGVAPWSAHSQTCGDATTVGGLTVEELGAQGGGDGGGDDPLTVEALQALLDSVYLSVDWLPAWEGLQSVPAGFADGIDDDTIYTAGAGLTLDGASFSIVAPSETTLGGVHSGTCEVGAVVTGIDASGTIVCAPDETGAGPGDAVDPPPGYSATTTLTTSSFLAGTGIAARNGFVYFSKGVGPTAGGDYTIERVAMAGGPPTTLLELDARAQELAVDDEHLYWRNTEDELHRMPLAGGDAELLGSGTPTSAGLIVHGDLIVWGTWEGVRSMNKAGGLVSAHCAHSVSDVVAEGATVYHSGSDGVFAIDLDGTETPLAPGLPSGHIALTSTSVVVGGNNVLALPKSGGPVARVPAARFSGHFVTAGEHVIAVGEGGVLQAFHPQAPSRVWVLGGKTGITTSSQVAISDGTVFGFEQVPGENNTHNVFSLDVSWAVTD